MESNNEVMHTPEPWFYQEDSDEYTHIIRPESNPGMIVVHLRQDSTGKAEADARRIVACVNAFEGVPIEEFDGKSVAEYVTGKTMITGIGPSEKGGFGIQLEGGACGLLAHAFAEQFKGSGAVNYLEINFTHKELGGMSVTMQRTSGKTPGQLKSEAVAQRDDLLAALKPIMEQLDGFGGEITSGYGPDDDLLAPLRAAIAKCEVKS